MARVIVKAGSTVYDTKHDRDTMIHAPEEHVEQMVAQGVAYRPPAGHTKHLSDSERAHSGEPGSQVRHGASATQYRYGVDKKGRELNTDVKGWAPGTDKWRE